MRRLIPILALAPLFGLSTTAPAPAEDAKDTKPLPVYEMREYYAKPGKLDEIHKRYKEHTIELMKKHGITPVAFFVPEGENKQNKLIVIFSFPSKKAREVAWEKYLADPQAKRAFLESQKDGQLEGKVTMRFLTATDYSPEFKIEKSKEDRIFELRTYIATKGNLGNLNDRFKNHTLKLFEKHGMTNIVYWNVLKGEPDDDKLLIYLLAHKSKDARNKSFMDFGKDPDWIAAKKASEEKGGGSLTEPKGGVVFEFLKPTDYSPLK
jgi:hypothetical protein